MQLEFASLLRQKTGTFSLIRLIFRLRDGSRVAEIAGIMQAVFAFHRYELFFLSSIIEDTTANEDLDALECISGMDWIALDHPAKFFNTFSN